MLDVLPASPWIFIGDFNAEPDSPELIRLAEFRVKATGLDHEFIGTFHNFLGGDSGECIDHMFVSTGLHAVLHKVDQTTDGGLFPSDHYPVIYEVPI